MAKYQQFLSRIGSNRDRAALRGIFSQFLTDGDPPALKDLVLASIILSGTETTQITISGANTTGILLSGTSSGDGISITGVCADGIHISGANTVSALHISGNQVDFALFDVDAAADNGLKILVDDGITLGTGINIDRSGTTGICTTAISIDTDGTTGIEIAAGFTGVTGLVIAGTASGDGILVSGACADGIHISGTNTASGLHISGDQVSSILIDVDAAVDNVISVSVDDGITATVGINIARTGTTGICTTGIMIDTDGTTALWIGTGFTGTTGILIAGTAADGIVISGACSDNAIEITGVATGAGILIDYTIPGVDGRALHVDCDTAATTGDTECMVLAYTNSAAGINNMRAFTSDLVMGAGCAGPYAGYFRTDCVTYQVGGLGAALGTEVCLPGATLASGEFHNITLDFECPTSFSTGSGGKHSFIKCEIWGETTPKNVFDDAFNLFFLNGMTSAAGNLVSADEQTLRINIEGTSRYLMLSHAENYLSLTGTMADAIVISGTCTDNAIEITGVAQGAGILIDYTIPTATSYALHIDCDTALAAGDVEGMVLALTNSASGINNFRAFTSDLTMGASCAGPYAGYFRTDCVSYQVTGLGAALGVEVCLPGATLSSGEFHGITIDFECAANGAGFGTGTGKHSFIKCEIWGDTTAKNNFDDGWNLLYLNGISAGSGSMFDSTVDTIGAQIDHTLRININGTAYYIPLMDNANGS